MNRIAATRAFVEAMGGLGNYYTKQYLGGNRDVIGVLTAEEGNLLRARSLARDHGWWSCVIRAMQGLRQLYGHTGRDSEWSRLVDEIVPDFVESSTEGPLPGREQEWNLFTQDRVHLARKARRLAEAERLQKLRIDWSRHRAGPIVRKAPKEWDDAERDTVRSLATSLHEFAQIQREQGSARCVDAYREALSLAENIQDSSGAAICALNLGHAYLDLKGLRDLTIAEHWYGRSLELHPKQDVLGRGKCLNQLGAVSFERFEEARQAKQPPEECLAHLSKAAKCSRQALEMFPPDAMEDLAVVHNQLGNISARGRQLETALHHYGESTRYKERQGDRFGAGQTRFNAAAALAFAGRFADARDWAQAALRDFQACENADQELLLTLKLLERIESALRGTSPPS
ncbi:MAG: hypothetical protein C5B51_10300 [Terriglobia bacterium]|nr:MAG: hypothetical protein C5B51_10300 [Terriglobia bacterium]